MVSVKSINTRLANRLSPAATVSGGAEGERSLSAGWHEPLTHSFCDTLSWF